MPKIKKPVKVSIIIPTLNEQSYLRKLLDDIKSQRIDDKLCSEIEIIVADGHSKDKTRQIAKSYGAKIVDGPYHPGIGRNNGAKVARGEIIYFMDADILLKDNSFIQKTLKEFITKKLDCATVPQLPFFNKKVGRDKKNFITGLFIMSNILVELNRKSRPRATATCMILRKKSFLKVKGFDPRIYWGEDSELAERMFKKKYKYGIIRSMYVYISPRKVFKHGTGRFFWNAIKLDIYRTQFGEIYSKEQYRQIASINDYFALKK